MVDIFRSEISDTHRLRTALDEADIATLAMVLVQFTADSQLLDRVRPFVHGPWNYAVDMPSALQREIRERLADALQSFTQSGSDLPSPPSRDLLQRMMSTAVGENVPAEYVPMMLEELAFDGGDPREVKWTAGSARGKAREFNVLVIGAGMSGVLAAIKLKRMGVPFVVLEKNSAVGGTWHENTYPGCGVDTPNHLYSFSFEPDHIWTRFFSKQPELERYFERCVERHDLWSNIDFNTRVKAAVYSEESCVWTVTAEDEHGRNIRYTANAIISAVGQLNRPVVPNISGIESFAGGVLHTGKWDQSYDLRERRVAMVGTGASGMQAGPEIARDARSLAVFQRTPHWILKNPNYHEKVSAGKKWVLEHVPYYARWYRFQLFWAFSDGIHSALQIDPNWPHQDRSLNEINERFRKNLTRYAEEQLAGREDLIKKVIPKYPPYGKRMLIDNKWFDMLKQDNVELVSDHIDHIEEHAIVTKQGDRHEVDTIVFATGFDAHRMLFPMEIRGRGGVSLRDVWGDDDPRAHLGISMPGFPNFFVLFGPNTNLGHGGSIMFHSECQIRFIMKCLRRVIEGRHAAIEVRQEAHDLYNERCDAAHERMVWAHKGTDNWYRNAKGRVVSNSPWRLVEYWSMTKEPNFREFNIIDRYEEGESSTVALRGASG